MSLHFLFFGWVHIFMALEELEAHPPSCHMALSLGVTLAFAADKIYLLNYFMGTHYFLIRKKTSIEFDSLPKRVSRISKVSGDDESPQHARAKMPQWQSTLAHLYRNCLTQHS